MTTLRPTAIQRAAINNGINNGRVIDSVYSPKTLSVMERNGWVTTSQTASGGFVYKVTPEAAKVVGQFTLSDVYRREDDLDSNPKARRQAEVITMARQRGIVAFSQVGDLETVSVSVDDLAALIVQSQ